MNNRALRFFIVLLLTFFLGGCLTNPAYREGRELVIDGQDELALKKYKIAASEDPGNAEYQLAYLRLRERLITRWLEQGSAAQRVGNDAEAEKFFQKTLEEDPANARARNALTDIKRDNRHKTLLNEAEAAIKQQNDSLALMRLRTILSENPENARALELKRQIVEKGSQGTFQPQLAAALKKPLTIEFKDAPLRQVFEVLSRTSGLNFVFDKDINGDQRTTIFLRNTTISDALNLLLLTNQLEQRVLDGSSILVFPNTAAKLKDYQALTVKTFFLSNADAKTAAANLKAIIRTKDIIVDEKQNQITMRDTPDAIRMAEKLLAMQDLPEPEVMLEVTILEVSRSRLLNLGIQWPDQLSLAPLAGPSGVVTLEDLKNLDSRGVSAQMPPMTLNARKVDGDTNILANPRIRARNRETAKVMIGERVPNITTTLTSTGFSSENIQYVDIGLKLEVQPTVYADNEIAIKITLEVSTIIDKVETKSGALAYQIGTRNAATVLRLKDGENQILAGLIRDDTSSSGNKVPGLGDLPLLGRLFGSQRDENRKSELILSITPRLIRDARRPEYSATEFDSGSESMLRVRAEGSDLSTPTGKPSAPPDSPSLQPLPGSAPEAATPTGASTDSSASIAPPNATRLLLQGPAQVKAGGNFTVQLAITPGEAVSSIPLALSYDPKVFEAIGVTEGDFLKQENGTTSFSNRVVRTGGQIFATVTRSGEGGASQPGNIVAIEFKALSPAKTSAIQVAAIAPIGVGGSAVNATAPPPLIVNVTP